MMSPSIEALFKKYLHCLIFLWFGGVTLLGCFCSQAEEPLPDGDTGALSMNRKLPFIPLIVISREKKMKTIKREVP